MQLRQSSSPSPPPSPPRGSRRPITDLLSLAFSSHCTIASAELLAKRVSIFCSFFSLHRRFGRDTAESDTRASRGARLHFLVFCFFLFSASSGLLFLLLHIHALLPHGRFTYRNGIFFFFLGNFKRRGQRNRERKDAFEIPRQIKKTGRTTKQKGTQILEATSLLGPKARRDKQTSILS
ncbi:hypothetical protein B0T16DRAFT_126756 [Cercophora newfieldiana]|uniref:Transmembrane protein n=1 Tax=Cercophora newfieldiana TaxID=92897 RepID=A0AA39YCZ0_9PEZI|nr:hypothetical protein B0T16DRAFT_126756 [Cercophora newfieldiana]